MVFLIILSELNLKSTEAFVDDFIDATDYDDLIQSSHIIVNVKDFYLKKIEIRLTTSIFSIFF